jgi:PHD/YefM family antitoxin component YafN of YafNO toxin-antitoxin module
MVKKLPRIVKNMKSDSTVRKPRNTDPIIFSSPCVQPCFLLKAAVSAAGPSIAHLWSGLQWKAAVERHAPPGTLLNSVNDVYSVKDGVSMKEVASTEFTKNFGRYREIAQREPVAVLSHGRTTGYFISAHEFEALQRMKAKSRRVMRIEDFTEEEIEQLAASRMSPEHDHLNSLLDDE